MNRRGVTPVLRFTAAGLVLVAAYAMKAYYRDADSQALAWLLSPTAALVEWLSGIPFTPVDGSGWLNLEQRVVIAPACAGINYLIIAFCMSSFQGIFALSRTTTLLGWLFFSAAAALCLTIPVNSLRIWISIGAFHLDPADGLISAESLHRLVGITIYYVFLFFHYLLVSFMLKAVAGRRDTAGVLLLSIVPLFWYLVVALGLPLINNGSLLFSTEFTRHSGMVVAVSLLLTCLFGVSWLTAIKLVRRIPAYLAGQR